MIRVVRCSGFATIQDLGWRTGRAMGLPRSGALDQAALRTANALVGNPDGAAGLEIALGSVVIELERPAAIAATGAVDALGRDDGAEPAGTTVRVEAGQRLTVTPASDGRVAYLAIDGGVAVEPMLGSRATYLPTGLGGWQGRRLESGDRLPLGSPASRLPPAGFGHPPDAPEPRAIRITDGPQLHLFDRSERAKLEASEYLVSPSSDRMGTRLVGTGLVPRTAAAAPSEATCLGAIQVPDGGQPIVLLADGPTVGGYPKIGAVISADLDRFAQIPLGRPVRFEWVTVAEAQRAGYERTERIERLLSAIRTAYRAR